MAKVSAPKQLSRDGMVDAPKGDWLDQVLRQLNLLSTDVNNALGGNITLTENLKSQLIRTSVNVPSSGQVWDGVSSSGGSSSSTVAGAPNWFDVKPTSPHPWDLEFESSTIQAPWVLTGSAVAAALDPYSNFTTANQTRYDLNSRRPSWLMCQPSNNAAYTVPFALTSALPTNLLMWTRVSTNMRNFTSADGDALIGINIGDKTAPSNTGVEIFIAGDVANGIGVVFRCWLNNASVYNKPYLSATAYYANHGAPTYIVLHKRGWRFDGWVLDLAGNPFWLGNYTFASAFGSPWVRPVVGNANTGGGPGSPIMGYDFIRFLETADFPFT